MRILLLLTGLRLGGAELQVAALAFRYRALGHDVAVVSLTPECEITLPPDATVLRLDMRKTPASMARALWQVRRFVSQWRPDIIHAHMIHANLFARFLTRLGATSPLICTAHSAREGGRARMLGYRVTENWADLTTHVSAEGRARMIAAGAATPERIVVVPNGIDVARFRPDTDSREQARAALGIGASDLLVLTVGRLVPEKNQLLLLDAFRQLLDDREAEPAAAGVGKRRVCLMIAGDGPLRAALQARIEAWGLEDAVTLLGVRHDIPALMNAADLFVLSSDIEGFGLVVGEALACGCPVVATDAAGVPGVMGADHSVAMHDRNCRIVPRGDTRAMAAAMQAALAEGRGSIDDIQARHADIGARLSLEAVADLWLAHYAGIARRESH